MRHRPVLDRETKVLIGVWLAFMLWVGFYVVCQVLIYAIVIVARINT